MKRQFNSQNANTRNRRRVRAARYAGEDYSFQRPSEFLLDCIDDQMISARDVVLEFCHYCSEDDIARIIQTLELE